MEGAAQFAALYPSPGLIIRDRNTRLLAGTHYGRQ